MAGEIRKAEILPERGNHVAGSLLPPARCLVVAYPDRYVDTEHDDDEVDRHSEPIVALDMFVEAAGAQLSLLTSYRSLGCANR